MNTIETQRRERHPDYASLEERITAEISKAMGEVEEKDRAELQEFVPRYAALVKAAYLEEVKKEALEQAKKIQVPFLVYEKFRPFMTGFYTFFLMMVLIPVGIGTNMLVTLLPLFLFFYWLNRSRHPLMTLTAKGLLLGNLKTPIPWTSIQGIKTNEHHADRAVFITLSLKEDCDLPWISGYGRIIYYRKKYRVWIHSSALKRLNIQELEALFTRYQQGASTQNQYFG